MRRRARQLVARPLFGGKGRRRLESRAAREVEDLGLVVLALVERERKVEADRTHRRRPDDARTDRGADLVRIPDLGAAWLGDQQRVLRRAIDVAEKVGEVGLPAVADQVAGV